jgi:pimeloyl-ACP methyl ester carboxylesterase
VYSTRTVNLGSSLLENSTLLHSDFSCRSLTRTGNWGREKRPEMVVRLFVGLAKLVACCYGTFVGVIFIFQRKLQYFPLAKRPPHPSHFSPFFASVEDISIVTADNVKLDGWFWPADKNRKHANVSILHLHGNAGNRQHRLGWAYAVRQRYGCAVTLVDYRGYGGNEGSPSEAGLILDAIAAITWHCDTNGGNGAKLVLHLESIGSVAGIGALRMLDPVRRTKIVGIVVEGGLSSCIDVVKDRLRFLPLSVLMMDKWSGACAAASKLTVETSFLSLHGSDDTIVPLSLGRKLYEAVACKNKEFVQFVGGGHNDLLEQPMYLQTLDKFYTTLVSLSATTLPCSSPSTVPVPLERNHLFELS